MRPVIYLVISLFIIVLLISILTDDYMALSFYMIEFVGGSLFLLIFLTSRFYTKSHYAKFLLILNILVNISMLFISVASEGGSLMVIQIIIIILSIGLLFLKKQ